MPLAGVLSVKLYLVVSVVVPLPSMVAIFLKFTPSIACSTSKYALFISFEVDQFNLFGNGTIDKACHGKM